MSEVDKDLSERYRAAARDEPPAHVDAAILAAAKRAVGSQPQPAGAPRRLRRWYVPVSLAAVIMLSVIVTLRIERERPEIAMPDSVPVETEKKQKVARQAQEPPAAAPASAPAVVASRLEPKTDSLPAVRQKERKSAQQAPEPGIVPPVAPLAEVAPRAAPNPAPAQPAAPVFAPDPKPARNAAPEERQREDSLRSADAARGPAASSETAGGKLAGSDALGRMRSEAREMSAPAAKPAESPLLAKRELAPEEWLERIADLRRQQHDREADEQFAEFKRRYPDYRISDAMTERIAPRK
jgi:hypothetical protein